MLNEEFKQIVQSCKCKRRLTKASGALRKAQGPGYGGSRPSFPRMRDSRDKSCKEWIPAFARMTKGWAPSTSSGTGLRRLSPVIPANAGIQR
jgi:hypothetical protein